MSTSSSSATAVSRKKKRNPSTVTQAILSEVASETAALDIEGAAADICDNAEKITTKRIIIGTLHCKSSSYISAHKDGIMMYIESE